MRDKISSLMDDLFLDLLDIQSHSHNPPSSVSDSRLQLLDALVDQPATSRAKYNGLALLTNRVNVCVTVDRNCTQ